MRPFLASLCTVALFACSSSSPNDSTGPDAGTDVSGELSFSDFVAQRIDAECSVQMACNGW
jgi:hypothetical protein